MENRRKLLLVLAAILLSGCSRARVPKEPITKSDFMLNTFVTVTVYDSQDETLLDNSLSLCREYESLFSRTIETSEIAGLNGRGPDVSRLTVSEDTARLIEKGLEYSEISGGAFDITIEPVSSLWNFTGEVKQVPDPDRLKEAAGKVDYRQVSVEGNQVVFSAPDTRIELGAIAKGFIADRMKEYLMGQGVKSATINLGGNVLCIGRKPDGTPFKIGLQKPFENRNETIAVLNIDNQSVVTSGIYERCFKQDGILYHHILNPEDGYPYNNGLLGVTIVSPMSVDGDGLSTACFSLGLEAGMALVDSLPDTYGYFITDDGKVHYSEGAKDLLAR